MNTGLGQFIPAVLYIGILLTCAVSLFWRPRFGLYVLVLLLPLQTTRLKIIGFPLGANVIFLLLFSVLLGAFFKQQGSVIPHSKLNKWILAFVLYSFLSLWYGSFATSQPLPLWISDPRFAAWKDYMAMPLLYVASSAVLRDRRHMRWMMMLMCLSILVVDYSAVREIMSHDFSHFDENKRNGGPLGYAGANGLGVFEALVSLLLTSMLTMKLKKWARLALLSILAASVYCVLFSFSRESYLSLIIGLIVFSLLRQRKLLLPIALLLCFSSVTIPTAVQERIAGTNVEGRGLDESSQERVDLWTDAVQLIEQSPIMGYGFGTYRFMNRLGPLHDTHNVYLKIAVEGGVISLLLFIFLLLRMALEACTLLRAKDDFVAALGLAVLLWVICAAIANFFGDRWTYIELSGFLWVLAALVARCKEGLLKEVIPGDISDEEDEWSSAAACSGLQNVSAYRLKA